MATSTSPGRLSTTRRSGGDGLGERPRLQVQPPEHEIHADVPAARDLFERGNGLRRIRRRIVAGVHRRVALAEVRVGDAEDPVRFEVRRIQLEGRFGLQSGLDRVVLTLVHARELRPQLGRLGIERDRALVRRNRLVDAALALEPAPEQEQVRGVLGRRLRPGLTDLHGRAVGGSCEHEQGREDKQPHLSDYNDVSGPRDANALEIS